MFKGRKIVIATKHGKEKVMAPLLEKELGLIPILAKGLDTDLLGTFSGEVDRKKSPVETAKEKCLMAMELTNSDLAISNEGSFGPHPQLFFLPADEEIVYFFDKLNNIEITAAEINTSTNFSGKSITNETELSVFGDCIGFPSHTLIAKKAKDDQSVILKNINSWDKLYQTFNFFMKEFGSIFLETDMRAMNNPSRMSVIEKATKKMIEKINSCCPECKTPGWCITDSVKGLPCEKCQFPTNGLLKHIYQCKKCSYTETIVYPKGKRYENPMYCDICNP